MGLSAADMIYKNRCFLIVVCLVAASIWLFSSIWSGDVSRVQSPSWLRNAPADVLNETLGVSTQALIPSRNMLLLMRLILTTVQFQKVFVINLPSRSDRRDMMALAGSLTGVEFDWVDGVSGDDVPEKVLPADSLDKHISKGNKGSWRAHMNALRR